jgi:hypothetical protein
MTVRWFQGLTIIFGEEADTGVCGYKTGRREV